jgi:hypothetical protein
MKKSVIFKHLQQVCYLQLDKEYIIKHTQKIFKIQYDLQTYKTRIQFVIMTKPFQTFFTTSICVRVVQGK